MSECALPAPAPSVENSPQHLSETSAGTRIGWQPSELELETQEESPRKSLEATDLCPHASSSTPVEAVGGPSDRPQGEFVHKWCCFGTRVRYECCVARAWATPPLRAVARWLAFAEARPALACTWLLVGLGSAIALVCVEVLADLPATYSCYSSYWSPTRCGVEGETCAAALRRRPDAAWRTVNCPSGCGGGNVNAAYRPRVYGGEGYWAANSQICNAAAFDGAVGGAGGNVQWRVLWNDTPDAPFPSLRSRFSAGMQSLALPAFPARLEVRAAEGAAGGQGVVTLYLWLWFGWTLCFVLLAPPFALFYPAVVVGSFVYAQVMVQGRAKGAARTFEAFATNMFIVFWLALWPYALWLRRQTTGMADPRSPFARLVALVLPLFLCAQVACESFAVCCCLSGFCLGLRFEICVGVRIVFVACFDFCGFLS